MEPLKLSSVFLAVLVIGLTGLLLDYAVGKIEALVTGQNFFKLAKSSGASSY